MAGDPNYAEHIKLLLPMSGAHNATVFVDHSPSPRVMTSIGNARITTALNDPFSGNAGVAIFDGTGDWIETTTNLGDFAFGTGDFTVEAFIKMSAQPADRIIVDFYKVNFSSWQLFVNAAGMLVFYQGNPNFSAAIGTLAVNNNSWHHIVACRNGDQLRLFVDGFLDAVATNNKNHADSVEFLAIGAQINTRNATYDFNGLIANVRIENKALYTAAFAPPTAPFLDYQAQIAGTVVESLAASKFVARAFDIADGHLAGEKQFTSGAFTIDITTSSKACHVTVFADGKVWGTGVLYPINAIVFPIDPVAKPYYFKRLIAGISGETEPVWPTTPTGQCDDGDVINAWELVERLIQPFTQGPLIPS